MELEDPKKCPSCGGELLVVPNMCFWRGKHFTGLICEPCNAMWDNPEDSFLEYVRELAKKVNENGET